MTMQSRKKEQNQSTNMSSCPLTAIVLIFVLFSPISTIASLCQCHVPFNPMVHVEDVTHCKKLRTLGAEFGWRVHKNESIITICIGTRLESAKGWLAWGVNPKEKPQMVGTRALIGIKQPNGSMVVSEYNVTRETKLRCGLQPLKIDVGVLDMKSDYMEEIKYYKIYATVALPSVYYNISKLNHVWQVGYTSNGAEPLAHSVTVQNMDSTETIDLRYGISQSNGVHWHRQRHRLRMVHGILDMVGWGIFLPVGAIIARYFRRFPIRYTHWFRLHISCQIIGYTLGTTGWSIGLWLGHASKYYSFPTHGLIGTFIFTFTTLQMLALRLKPKKDDEYRKYWNMYHHFLGYSLLALIIVNIFRGIRIFAPSHNWRWAYIGVLGVLASIALALEIYTWIKFIDNKKRSNDAQKQSTSQQSATQPQAPEEKATPSS